MVPMRCLVAALVLGILPSRAASEGAADAFNARFGAECARVEASRDPADDAALASRLLDATREEGTDPALASVLLRKAWELGSKHAAGYATAITALDLLAERDPDRRLDWLLKLADLRQKVFDARKGGDRVLEGDELVDALLAAAEAKGRVGAWGEGAALCRRAMAAARAAGLDRKKEIAACQECLTIRQRAERRVSDLEAQLAANPQNGAARLEAIRLCVMELGDPARGATLVDESCPDDVRKYVPAAAKGVDAAPELACPALGAWYAGLAEKASPTAQASVLGRACAYYDRFLQLHQANDAARSRAEAAMKKAEDALVALGASGQGAGGMLVLPGPWVDVLRRVDPAKDAVKGQWTMRGGRLTGSPMSLLTLPAAPEGSYQVSMRFTRTEGSSDVALILPVESTSVAFAVSRDGGGHSELTIVTEGVGRVRPGKLVNGALCTLDCSVAVSGNQASVSVDMDGKPYFKWSGAVAAMGTEDQYRLPDLKYLGLQLHAADAVFESIRLRMTSGRARLLR